jgi:pantoate--beta-alanine ligase
MSSRNAYLSGPERQAALCLPKALQAATAQVERGETDTLGILGAARRVIIDEPLAHLDYAAVVDPDTLEEVTVVCGPALLALAVNVGKTRLIDNCVLSRQSIVDRGPIPRYQL